MCKGTIFCVRDGMISVKDKMDVRELIIKELKSGLKSVRDDMYEKKVWTNKLKQDFSKCKG